MKVTNSEERKQLVRARDCKSNLKCKNCKGNHHVSLCETKPKQTLGGSCRQSTGNAVNAPSSMRVGT